jgi:hypothetical protein
VIRVGSQVSALFGELGHWKKVLLRLMQRARRRIAKTLGHFARVGEATGVIAHSPGLLGSILNLINLHPFDAMPWET